MGSIKDRNGTDLTKAEDFKKMWKEYTEELYKKNLHDPDNHDGVITHLSGLNLTHSALLYVNVSSVQVSTLICLTC